MEAESAEKLYFKEDLTSEGNIQNLFGELFILRSKMMQGVRDTKAKVQNHSISKIGKEDFRNAEVPMYHRRQKWSAISPAIKF